ncbi:uncharacterized protein LOC116201048 [Punica granatum]|uniref:Uncharacterized protein LOC116201048 n=1 Tax=Punica granatum TaxID=22663 RepID=A0A6P8D0S8_PUNGR|nr:uncharacterized protein LOC116201048 [Punica granatum]
MFTEGLDRSALRWVREKEGVVPSSNLRPRIDPITGGVNGSRGFVLPPASKFRSGHLPPSAVPVSRTMPGGSIDSRSGSDNDMDTGFSSEEEGTYGARYSHESSPRDERVPNSSAFRYGQKKYAGDYSYSDVSSSRETIAGRKAQVPMGSVRGNGDVRYSYSVGSYADKDYDSDSASSSEFSTTQAGSTKINGTASRARGNTPTGIKAEAAAQKGRMKNLQLDEDIASAPPLYCFTQEPKGGTDMATRDGPHIEGPHTSDARTTLKSESGIRPESDAGNRIEEPFTRNTASIEAGIPSSSQPPRVPAFHASALGPWHSVIAYDACVRLCLNAWARGCTEAPMFLENECSLLRDTFGLQQVLLQSEEELLAKRSSEPSNEGALTKHKKVIGKMKVQVRKVKTLLDPPTGCSILALPSPSSLRPLSIKMETIRDQFYSLQSTLSSRWQALRKIRAVPRLPTNGSLSRQSMAYVHASTRYLKQVSSLLKTGVTSLRNSSSSYEVMQETYACLLRLKSTSEEDAVRMQPGSGEAHIFFPDTAGDDLIIEVLDSKGKHFGRAFVQLATVADDPADKLRWWSIFREPEHELVGKLQLYITYSTSSDDNSHLKHGIVAETVAYDLVLEVAMKVQQFQQRNLLLHGPWKWLLAEFSSYYGVSDVYTKLRYLSYVMDVATPTADCLVLIHDLLVPVLLKGSKKGTLSHQENRILGETKDQIEQILALAFENYKSLDESSLSGIMDVFRPATGTVAPALGPAVKLFTLLHDVFSPEVQTNLCHHFQVAAKKRAKRLLTETDDYVANNVEGTLLDADAMSTAYQKMTSLCMNIKNEIYTDIEIHNQHILPSFIDLPNLSASIYSTELCNRLRTFLTACPPAGPSPPVAELVIVTNDFQRDLASWKISPVKGGVDAKELFHLYILVWIQDKRLSLLETCKLDKVKWSGVRTQHSTTPFVDDMYDRLRETLNDYELIICRWPEYVFVLENAVADVEKAVVEALDKQYADVLLPLKDHLTPKKFGLKYVQKLAKRSACPYTIPDELGILLNSMKRMLDVLRPKIEAQFKTWGSCMPITGNTAPGERLSEVTVMLRSKFRNYLQAVVEKLAENMRLQPSTKLKKVLQDSKGIVVESDVRVRMQPLVEHLSSTMSRIHAVFETHVFVSLCRGYWDRMGQDVLSFLENRKENRSWYKGSRIAVSILDDTFASHMQQLLGNTVQEKELEPPRCIMEVRSILCKDGPDYQDNTFYY